MPTNSICPVLLKKSIPEAQLGITFGGQQEITRARKDICRVCLECTRPECYYDKIKGRKERG